MTTTELLERVRMRRSLPEPRVRRAIRLAAGVSQADVAEALGVAQRTVARWELGQANPRGASLVSYVELLDALRNER
jgi:transcriptional regulator with XRE-family HTH domain